MLRATLNRGNQLLSCDVIPQGNRRFAVIVVPHWDASESFVEGYETGVQAVTRHAELCWSLRQDGWRPVLSDGATAAA